MKIRRAVLREVSLELAEPFEISSGSTTVRRVLLLALEGDGLEGWGECVAGGSPTYSYETVETAWHVLAKWLLPDLLEREADDARDLATPPSLRGHPMAKATVEMATWDLEAKRRGISLGALLGGRRREVPVGVSVGIQQDDEALLGKVDEYLAEGYARIKIKIKPGRDVQMLAAVRHRHPDLSLTADANSAYKLSTDLDALCALDELSLAMIEQPLGHEDLLDHAALQRRLATPICLDESIRSTGDARLAIHIGAGAIINIKPGRVGGLAASVEIHDLCRAEGWPVWCGGMLESGIGRAHNVALATLPGFTLPGDISSSRRYWREDIVRPEFEMRNGSMAVPAGPGIGVTPRMGRIEALTLRNEVFTP